MLAKPTPPAWAAGPLLPGPAEICRAQFRTQLKINSTHLTVMIGDPKPVLDALRFEHAVLKQQLGQAYLGIALGGSLIHGLGTAKTADVNYYIYTRSLGDREAARINRESRQRLEKARLTPGEDGPVCDLEPREIKDLTAPLSVFANQITATPDRQALEAAALALIGRAAAEEKHPKADILKMLMEGYIELSGSNPSYAAGKFMKNRAPEFIQAGRARSLSLDREFMEELRKLALPFMVARLRHPNCRFPKQVWELLN